MGGDAFGLCDLYHFVEIGLLPDAAATDIGGLLDANDRLRRLVTAAGVKRGAKGVGRKLPVGTRQRRDLETPERGVCAAFASDDVRGLVRQDLVAGPGMNQCRGDIAHGAGRHEYGRLLAEQVSDHGRIVADLLVADLGPRDCLAHAGRRAGLGVRQQVDADRGQLRIARGRGVDHCEYSLSHSGMVRRTRPQMCNCTSGNLEIPGSRLRRAPE